MLAARGILARTRTHLHTDAYTVYHSHETETHIEKRRDTYHTYIRIKTYVHTLTHPTRMAY